ncbi:MAG: hypothetical protein HYR84_00490 [Planctomycetes bacterium]|nr:hypothetical protein [Planctomycetota bacterium]
MVTAIRDGDYDHASFQGRLALNFARRMEPADPPIAQTMIELARIKWKQGIYGAANDQLHEVRNRLEKTPGQHADLEARTWNLHAEVLAALGQNTDAGMLAGKAYKARLKKFGAEHLETVESIDTMTGLGQAYDEERGENFVSRSHWSVAEMSLKVREKLLGKAHPDTATSHVAIARNRPHDADAEKHLRLALKLWMKINPRHPELAETWTLLGRRLRLRGELDDADQTIRHALKLLRYHDDSGWPAKAGAALLELAHVRGQQHKIAEADKLYLQALEHHFYWLSDEELCGYFARIPFDRRSFGSDATTLTNGEAYLHEMVRRGTPAIDKALTKRAQELAKKLQASKRDDSPPRNLEVLTALRRLQKKADPIGIEVRGAGEIEAVFPNVPDLDVALVNQDERRAIVGYQAGGDYRTGRQERWRLDVRDAKGNSLPVIDYLSAFGGGLTGYSVLKPDQKWQTTLHVRSFIKLPPGDYTLRVQYHDIDSIAGLDWVGGRIVCQSNEIRLHIQPRVIDVSAEEKKTIDSLIEKIDGKQEVRVAEGPFGKEHHKLIAPDSPQGRLLSLGWKVVPPLIDEATHEATSPRRRAVLLSMLFTLTGYHDPRHESGVLPDYRGPGESASNAKIDHAKQFEFAKQWTAFRKHLVVRGE